MSYYPLKTGNSWTYKTNDGSTFTNAIISEAFDAFILTNSNLPYKTHVKKEGNIYYTDSYEAGNMQPFLKEGAKVGDKWDIKYKAHTIDSILSVEIRSVGGTKEVEGKIYNNVMRVDGNMSFIVKGAAFNANIKYTWYYADEVGLILTTSTLGESMPLVSSTL